MDPILLKFQNLTGIDIEKSIGKIPKSVYFLQKCVEAIQRIDSGLVAKSTFGLKGGAFCGYEWNSHTSYMVTITFCEDCSFKKLLLRNHYDKHSNVELVLVDREDKNYRSIMVPDCFARCRIFRPTGISKSFDEIIEMMSQG